MSNAVDLAAASRLERAGPCVLVIFGAAGDLTRRLLMPSLYNLAQEQLLPEAFAIVGVARTGISEDALGDQFRTSIREAEEGRVDGPTLDWLMSRFSYTRMDFTDCDGWRRLETRLAEVAAVTGTGGNALYYLATAPEQFLLVCERLSEHGLLQTGEGVWRRVVVEKPFGHDLESARELNARLRALMDERQIYRIDHYLGKETVQNILVFRFGNGIFEPVWNRRYIDHVQITVSETVGVEGRGAYYDTTGALRDMVPNHLFQLLTFTAMEPPSSFSSTAMHNEQLKVLESVELPRREDCGVTTVRARYEAGAFNGRQVPGYRDEPRVAPASATETFVAMRLFVDNWRWADVPFYVRTGKRLAAKKSEVVIQFRNAPLTLFRHASVELPSANRLVLSIQPEESIALELAAKVPGPRVIVSPVHMRFEYEDYFGLDRHTGYETLLYDAMTGDRTLFKRSDIIEAGWAVVQPVLEAWAENACGLAEYPAGSEGPTEGGTLIERDGRSWRRLTQAR